MFKQPNEDDCLNAIGLVKKQTREGKVTYEFKKTISAIPVFLRAVQPDTPLFSPVPEPGPNDWLANHEENGQTFEDFLHSNPNIPDDKRTTIHILPLTFFEQAVPPDVLDKLAQFASIFFNIPVKILEFESFSHLVQHRTNEFTGLVQVHAGEILEKMVKLIPSDSFCVGAITMCDLYPKNSWNFVFGIASLQSRVGVYSLARYMPGFNEGTIISTADMSSEEKSVLLKQSSLLMCHEMGHMFGLQHCIYFHCLMNGSNHFEESDKKPLHLCPVCLRKLHSSCRFDISDRYSKLANFCKLSGMQFEAEWFEKRLLQLKS